MKSGTAVKRICSQRYCRSRIELDLRYAYVTLERTIPKIPYIGAERHLVVDSGVVERICPYGIQIVMKTDRCNTCTVIETSTSNGS